MSLIKIGITCILLFASTSWICNEGARAESNKACIKKVKAINKTASTKFKELRKDVAKLKEIQQLFELSAKKYPMNKTLKDSLKLLTDQGVSKKDAEMLARITRKALVIKKNIQKATMILEDIEQKAKDVTDEGHGVSSICNMPK